jgi:hypothetical protein
MTLTPHPLLVPWSRKGSAISLLLLWAIRPVQSLSACTRVLFNMISAIYQLSRWSSSVQVWMEFHPNLHTWRSPTWLTYTRCHINIIDSSDDEHMGARNMYRFEINIYEKELCVKLVIYKNWTEMHGQQNVKPLQYELEEHDQALSIIH